MYDANPSIQKMHYAIGVFKFNYTALGYPELVKIGQEWARDENFYEIIVRGVSEKNYGIQFVYISQSGEFSEDFNPIKKYREELKEKYGDDFYAWDYEHGTYDPASEKSPDNKLKKSIVVLKGFKA